MKGSCAYTLSTNQIMRALALRSRVIVLLLPILVALGGTGWAVWQSMSGLIDEKTFIDWIMGTVLAGMILIFFMFAFLQIRANTAPSLPGGPTVLEWSPSGLAIRAGQEMFALRWEEVRWRMSRDGILLNFPNGRFTYVASGKVSDEDRASLIAALNASGMWSRELR